MSRLEKLENLTPEAVEKMTDAEKAALRGDIRILSRIGFQIEMEDYAESVHILAVAESVRFAIAEAEARRAEAEAEKSRKKTIAERIAEKAAAVDRPPTKAERNAAANRAKAERESKARTEAKAKAEAEAEARRADAKRKRGADKTEAEAKRKRAAAKLEKARAEAQKRDAMEAAKAKTPTENGKKAVEKRRADAEKNAAAFSAAIDCAKGATRGRRNHIQLKIERGGDTATADGVKINETRDAAALAEAVKHGIATYNYLNTKCNLLNAYAHKTITAGMLPTLERDTDKVSAEDLISEAKAALFAADADGLTEDERRREAMRAVGRVSGVSDKEDSKTIIDDCQLHENAVYYTETAGRKTLPDRLYFALWIACGNDFLDMRYPNNSGRKNLDFELCAEIMERVMIDGDSLRDTAEAMEISYGLLQRTLKAIKERMAEVIADGRTEAREHGKPEYAEYKITLPAWVKKAK